MPAAITLEKRARRATAPCWPMYTNGTVPKGAGQFGLLFHLRGRWNEADLQGFKAVKRIFEVAKKCEVRVIMRHRLCYSLQGAVGNRQ
jgi:hypothetical protein